MSEPFDDIAKAIHGLRVAFKKHGMEPPISIELGSVQDKQRFFSLMPRDMILANSRMGEVPQDAEVVTNLMGVEIRMPGEWRTDPNGKTKLV